MKKWHDLVQMCPRLYKKGMSFECGIGWYDIIRDVSIKIEKILDEYDKEKNALGTDVNEYFEIFAVQVKEKYGTLRFYLSKETHEISDLIQEANVLSREVCEICGQPASVKAIKWISVKCNKCFKEKA